MFSQNLEERVILNYFGDYVGMLLDLGCNDGVTFSNSRQLIENGWVADLVDASPTMVAVCKEVYKDNGDVRVYNYGVSTQEGIGILHESGAHVPNGKDRSLVSTIHEAEKARWPNVTFKQVEVPFITFKRFHSLSGEYKYEFISIDCEGCEWDILQQIDLTAVGCKCLCIEWNSNKELGELFKSYCTVKHGMRLLHTNAENMIFAL